MTRSADEMNQRAESERSHSGRFFTDPLAIGLISVFLLILFLPPILTYGPLLQTDQPLWAAVAHVWQTEVVPSQGWIPGTMTERVGAGLVAASSYSGSYILLYLLGSLFAPHMAVKVSMLVSGFLFLLSFYWLARIYFKPSYSLLATILLFAPCFDNFVSGMWYNYLSLGFGFVFWRLSNEYFRGSGRWTLPLATFSFAFAVYSHPVGAVFCACVWLAFVLQLSNRWEEHGVPRVFGYVALLPLAVLLSAPQVIAALTMTGSTPGPSGGLTPLLESVRRLFVIRVWGAMEASLLVTVSLIIQIFVVGVLSLLGFAAAFRNRQRSFLAVLAVLMLVNVILITRSYNLLPDGLIENIRSALNQQYSRFQLISQVYIVLLSVMGIWKVLDLIGRRLVGKNATIARVAALAPVLSIASQPLMKIYLHDTGQLTSLSQSQLNDELTGFWTWARENVDSKSARICFSNTFGELSFHSSSNPEASKTHVFALTGVYTEVNHVGSWAMGPLATAHETGRPLWSLQSSEEELREEIELLNCRYLVAVNETLRTKLGRSPQLQKALESQSFTVLQDAVGSPRWAWNMRTGEKVDVTFHAADDIEISAEGMKGDRIFLSRAYYPQWEAEQEGSPVKIENYREFIVVELPRSGSQTIRLRFLPDRDLPRNLALAGVLLTAFLALAVPKPRTMLPLS